jgi:hypothetical protein
MIPLQNATTPYQLFQSKFMLGRCNISTAEEYEWIGKWRMEAFEGIWK